ncbi:MAG: succinylglutamate desuccinylase/aspartoacylase family protein [Tissierellia bacterium]|jgi:hypothetical protein|nr:succinylglutamate desuccinylase/aspartoacylase family protein [Tissierellia bacterium]
MNKKYISGAILLGLALIIAFVTGSNYSKLHELPEIASGPSVTKVVMLSDYFSGLKDTPGDTPVYVMEGAKPGGKSLILGGTHPNEPSGHLSAILFIQNAIVDEGTVFVLPYTNRSAFTHNDPQEGSPQSMHFTTKDGEELELRYGSRATNPIHQWPDPDVYTHQASGQRLSGSETRNINRAYPGAADGNLTEKVAYGIVELIKKEDVNLTFDLHEASPEYPVINATVSHEKGMSIAAVGTMELQFSGIDIALEPSPVNLRGLTHRELGDYTDTIPLLMETANASQGRLRGKTDEHLALTGKDKAYVYAESLGFLYVPYDEKGHSIEERVGRHLQGIIEFTKAYNTQYPDKAIVFENVPTYEELFLSADESELGGGRIGQYLFK